MDHENVKISRLRRQIISGAGHSKFIKCKLPPTTQEKKFFIKIQAKTSQERRKTIKHEQNNQQNRQTSQERAKTKVENMFFLKNKAKNHTKYTKFPSRDFEVDPKKKTM